MFIAILKELLKNGPSAIGRLGSTLLELLGKAWKKIEKIIRRGVSHLLAPDLTEKDRASLRNLEAMVLEVKRKEEEKKQRALERILRRRAKADAAKESAVAEEAPAQQATAGAVPEPACTPAQQATASAAPESMSAPAQRATASAATAPVSEPMTKAAAPVRPPPFGPDATIRTAAVFKAVVPVAVRALVQSLGKVRRRAQTPRAGRARRSDLTIARLGGRVDCIER
jgi:hypothetical protein